MSVCVNVFMHVMLSVTVSACLCVCVCVCTGLGLWLAQVRTLQPQSLPQMVRLIPAVPADQHLWMGQPSPALGAALEGLATILHVYLSFSGC